MSPEELLQREKQLLILKQLNISLDKNDPAELWMDSLQGLEALTDLPKLLFAEDSGDFEKPECLQM